MRSDFVYLLRRRVRLARAITNEFPTWNLKTAWRVAGTIQTVALEQMRAES